jgi:toxin CcdB
MPQFSVHRDRKNPRGPYLLDVQSDLIAALSTRVVVPLYPARAFKGKTMSVLTPEFSISGKRYVMMTPQLAGIAISEIGEPLADLTPERQRILAALDMLITGI